MLGGPPGPPAYAAPLRICSRSRMLMPPVIMLEPVGQEFREAGGTFDLVVAGNAVVQQAPVRQG